MGRKKAIAAQCEADFIRRDERISELAERYVKLNGGETLYRGFIRATRPVRGPDGTIYRSSREAAAVAGVDRNTMVTWLRRRSKPGWRWASRKFQLEKR